MNTTQCKTEQPDLAPAALEKLLARVAQGDTQALAELYAAARQAVYAMALACLHNADEAQDVTQDTFVRIWEAAGGYRARGVPMAWVLTICRNLARMRLRRSGRAEELSEEQWNAIPSSSVPALEDRLVLQTALGALEDAERQVVLLHVSSGLKHREIAELLGLPVSTILSRYNRAMKKMRAQLEGDDAR